MAGGVGDGLRVQQVLMHEIVVNTREPGWMSCSNDLTMMMMFASTREQTERDWERVLERVGLQVARVWSATAHKSVVEAGFWPEASERGRREWAYRGGWVVRSR